MSVPLLSPDQYPSIVHLMRASFDAFGSKPALVDHRGEPPAILTYGEFGRAVDDVAMGLRALGIGPDDRVAILSYNRPEWPICDLAIMTLGAITVPLQHTLPPNQIEYILRDAGVRAIVVEDAEQHAKIAAIAARCPELQHVVSLARDVGAGTPFEDVRACGRKLREREPGFIGERLRALARDMLCSIVYTSGTTGEPKGVMLHHRGFLAVLAGSLQVLDLRPDDVFLSFLPLSHLYERVAGHWCPLARGCTIAYAKSTGTVIDDLTRVRPTVMVSVPRVYEKLRGRVETQAAARSAVGRRVFHWALDVGRRYHQARVEGRVGAVLALKHRMAERMLFRRIREGLGGRFRFPISGGAPLSVDTLAFFEAMGFGIVEGYGMTETHLIITLTPAGGTRRGSCGRPIPGVEVSVAADGEVLVRGDTVMRGYHHREPDTREAIDADRWLHTGDIGHLDDDGFLYITDRKKNIIVTAGGKNVAPAPIENDLKASPFIEEACVIGDRRRFIAALIVPDFDYLEIWARARGLDVSDRRALVEQPAVTERIMQEVQARQAAYAVHEQVKKFALLAEPFSLERGELTSSLKVRRRVVEQHFSEAIERLYSASA